MNYSSFLGHCSQITLNSGKIIFARVVEVSYLGQSMLVFDEQAAKLRIYFEEIRHIRKVGESLCGSQLLNGFRFHAKKDDK
ncbi:hypothetical protein GFC29_3830 (plasmid) [Anoxybacillus sp. B7M1]|nr:hypothetical protein GFC29_3830 [Anoxybacillus sp. B7M1]